MKVAGVIIYNEHAYVPTDAQMKSGAYLSIEPVQTTNLDVKSLGHALQRAYDLGNPQIEDVNHKEYSKNDPTLKASKARSWKQLARKGATYSINWLDNEVVLYMSKVDNKGRFIGDPSKERHFSLEITMDELAQLILDDYNSRPFDNHS